MRTIVLVVGMLLATGVRAEQWLDVGADTEAKYFVDIESLEVDGDTVRVKKRGVYTHPLTETLGGKQTHFKETIGTLELDCGRRINRIVQIDMLDESGALAWSSGRMPRRLWEDVKPNTHGETTLELVCSRLKHT